MSTIVTVFTRHSANCAHKDDRYAKRALAEYRAKTGHAAPGKPFPHCPKCGSYCLWRKDKTDPWDCESCGERSITDEVARRVQ